MTTLRTVAMVASQMVQTIAIIVLPLGAAIAMVLPGGGA